MKLLCQYDDGTTVNLRTAIQKDPYRVRGLVSEAYFQCLVALPDTDAFLRAEHSVRDALLNFDGSEDRFSDIKAYVTSRVLDSRTKLTPRVNIIQTSFNKGGPLGLVGAFHATFNVSRNPRSRETLVYLLGTNSESQNELFERARTFPRHPSTGPWFQQIIDRLEPDAQSIACLLVSLGSPPHDIPPALFARIRQPSCTWGIDGEIVRHVADLEHLLGDEDRFSSALHTLQFIGLVKSTVGLRVDQQLAGLIDNNLRQWHKTSPTVTFLSQAIEACLSSLEIGELGWKMQAISHAEHLLSLFAGREPGEFEILRARVAVHKARLKVTQSCVVTEQDLNINYPCDNHRSHAFSAELAIVKAHVQIDLHNLTQALQEICSFDAAFNGSTSTLSNIMSDRVALLRGSILRINGNFVDAYSTLQPLPPTDDTISQFSAVLCERGECESAIKWLKVHLQLAPDPKTEALRLAWAHVHLFNCMRAEKNGQKAEASLQIATETYLSLQGVQNKLEAFSILVGQAILLHIQGKIVLARKAWVSTLAMQRSTGLPPGYFDALLSFSLSDLTFREYRTDNSILHKTEAGILNGPNTKLLAYSYSLRRLMPYLIGSLVANKTNQLTQRDLQNPISHHPIVAAATFRRTRHVDVSPYYVLKPDISHPLSLLSVRADKHTSGGTRASGLIHSKPIPYQRIRRDQLIGDPKDGPRSHTTVRVIDRRSQIPETRRRRVIIGFRKDQGGPTETMKSLQLSPDP
ncbi:hypothetical protein GGS21DRAFT_486281 [Xylaria nigripes]|nr:hypothetical protein GGS21DRAFT_486281 [Xylaria nigripes]